MKKSNLTYDTKIFDLEVSQDKLTALVAIKDFTAPPNKIALQLKELLIQHNIKRGYLVENIKRLIKERNPNLKLPVAKGKPPFPGRPSTWEFTIRIKESYPPEITEKQPINLREEGLVNFVRAGELIAKYLPGKPSLSGVNIFGEPIPVKPFTPQKLQFGENVTFDKEARGIKAVVDGFVRKDKKNTIFVEPVTVLEQADPRTGELQEKRSVVILKDVRFGARLFSEKDVWVQGVVEDAYINAKGNVVLLGGAMGKGKGKIIAGKNIYLFAGRYQQMYAEGSIYFEEELVGCSIAARRKIISHFGRMVGGKAVASKRIYIHSVGSQEGIHTVLEAGIDETLEHRYQKEQEILKGYLDEVVVIKQEIYDLVLKQIDAGLTEEEEKHLQMLQHKNEIIPQRLKEIEEKINQLEQEKKELLKADIVVPDELYDGVEIAIRNDVYEVKKPMRLRRFYAVGEKIRMEVFKKD